MKKELKPINPKFYLGHSTDPKYVEVECLFTYNNQPTRTLYLVETKEGKKDRYYLAKARELYKRELKSGQLAKEAHIKTTPHYYRNRNLIIVGSALLAIGLITMTTLLIIRFRPNYQAFDYFKKQDGTYEILKVNGEVTNLVIPETYNGEPITSIADNAVREHRELKTLQLSNNLQTIGFRAFFGDSSLETVTFPTSSNALPSLKIIGSHAFGECYSLKDLYIPDGVHEIGTFAFQNNRAIRDLFIPWNVQKIETDAFNGCANLTFYLERKEIPTSWSTKWNSSNRPYILDSTRDTPGTLTIEDGLMFRKVINPLDKDDVYAEIVKFDETTNDLPEQLDIPETVEIGSKDIPVTNINENAFAVKPKGNVRWVVIPSSITYVGANAFKALTNTLIFVEEDTDQSKWNQNWDNGALKTYTDFTGFHDDTYGTKQKIKYASIAGGDRILIDGEPDSDGSLILRGNNCYFNEIAPKAFASRDDINTVKTDGTDNNLKLIGDFAFANCYNLKTLDLECSNDLTIGSYAFYTTLYNEDNNGVTDITIKNSNKELYIGESAFQKGYKTTKTDTECTEIEQITLTNSHISIGQSAFMGCQFKKGSSIILDDACAKPGRYCFNHAGANLTINVSDTLFTTMQDEWGWPILAADVYNKLGLHEIDDDTYQLYSYVKPLEGESYISYERFGQAKIVVGS